MAELRAQLSLAAFQLAEMRAERDSARAVAEQGRGSLSRLQESLSDLRRGLEWKDALLLHANDDLAKLKASVLYKPFREIVRIERQLRCAFRWRAPEAPPIIAPEPATNAKSILRQNHRLRLADFLRQGRRLRLPASERPDVSILLVLFNQAELTFGCLTSIVDSLADTDLGAEVVIVDNHSTDDTVALLERTTGANIIRNPENVHFLRAANQAAAAASGRLLLFLNNDALLQPGSLEAAIRALDEEQDAGAVGGRIVLPDGTLQEAGSIIWRDGACSGYGRGGSPTQPGVMFRRDVDYCSGAFLLTPRKVFEDLSGFDPRYAPAYYEETDYCVRLWQNGRRVIYEPDALVLHYEFGSSARTEDALALQRRNRLTFVERHRAWLERQHLNRPENVLWARGRASGRPRILMIDDRVPRDQLGSGAPRARVLLRHLAALAEVTFFPAVSEPETWEDIRAAVPPGVEVMKGHRRSTLREFLEQRRGLHDAILVCRPQNMSALLRAEASDRSLIDGVQIIYDAEAISAVREAQKRLYVGGPSETEARRLLEEEVSLARRASQVIAVSRSEQELFKSMGVSDVRLLGHAFRPDPTETVCEARRTLLFVGAIHSEDSPNADSLRWFCAEILPRIRHALGSDLRLRVVGVNRAASLEKLDGVTLDLIGPVDDLRTEFEQARVFVAPTRFAAGIPHKIGQAAAYGVPVVATGLLAEQIDWTPGRELLAASDPDSFADACVMLYKDDDLWRRLRHSALERCRECWSPEAFAETVADIVAPLTAVPSRSARTPPPEGAFSVVKRWMHVSTTARQ